MPYICRSLEKRILEISKEFSCLLLTGPRQSGKTTMLMHLMKGTRRNKVSLDDFQNRLLAQREPALFLELNPAPLLIDEVQYAPELFSYIKIRIDNGAPPGSYWLTGSQSFQLMRLSQESLAGRMAVIHMSSLSQAEMYGDGCALPLTLEPKQLIERRQHRTECDVLEMYQRIWKGSLPGLCGGKIQDRDLFYSSYIQTYVYRDVQDILPGAQILPFSDFVRAAACRAGQLLNVHELARDVKVSDDTAGKWLQVLEKSGIIFYLRPYSNNLLKRTVKTPKMYFFDTGLVAYLTRNSSPKILMDSSINGAILENYVVSEIRKTWNNCAKDCLLYYYRDKDSNEIDLLIEADGELHPLEIKKSGNPGTELVSAFSVLDKSTVPRGNGAIICLSQELSAIDSKNLIIPVWMI